MNDEFELTVKDKYQLLRDISIKIKDTFDLNEILKVLLDLLKRVIDYDAAGIFVLSENVEKSNYKLQGQKIAGIAQYGFDIKPVKSDKMLWEGKGIVGYVINTKESVLLDDVRKDDRYVIGRKATLSEIAVPIIKDGIAIGALDVESDKLSFFNNHHLEILEFFADASAISLEKAILHQKIIEKNKLEEQMQIAKDVQSSLLPIVPPQIEGYDIASVYLPTYDIGGDYYDYITLDNENIGIIIADVSGHGIPAALIMAAFRAMLINQLKLIDNPSEVMNILNRQIPEVSRKRDFISSFYGKLNHTNHTFLYTNCGHNPPLILRENGNLESLERCGPALNIMHDVNYESSSVNIARGDQIILYTDGVIEIFNNMSKEFGLERLKSILSDHSKETAKNIVDHIVEETKTFAGTNFYNDDFTLIIIKRK